MSGKNIAILVGVAAVGGGVIWWLRSRDKKTSANQMALFQAAQIAQQQAQHVISAVPPSGAAPGLTAQQAAEMRAYPEARHGAGHFNGDPASTEAYANSGAGHF